MRQDQWETIVRSARMERLPETPLALIVDSPWIPGYTGISTLDYLTLPDAWLAANLQVAREFPRVIFMPGFWVEMGMAAEPSGFGGKVSFYADKTPLVYPVISSNAEVERLKTPNPRTDGLMPWILNLYRYQEPRVMEAGYHIKIVAARGPLAIATHLMGVTEFLLGLKLDPDNTHRLLRMTTTTARNWLEAQAETLREVEGVMLLDDIAGFLSPEDYQVFAHPYLKEIYSAFPGAYKFFHNDMNNPVSFPYLADLGVQVFNFTHQQPLGKVRDLAGETVCLMGNVAPLEVLAQGTPEAVQHAARSCLDACDPHRGLIRCVGGGVSPGTPGANVEALIQAVETYPASARRGV